MDASATPGFAGYRRHRHALTRVPLQLPVLIVSGVAALAMAGGVLILRGDAMTMMTRPTNTTYPLLQ
jgi:hypothetical protein